MGLPSSPDGGKPRTNEEKAGSASFTWLKFYLPSPTSLRCKTYPPLLIKKEETREGAVSPHSELTKGIVLPESQAGQREAAAPLLSPNFTHKRLATLSSGLMQGIIEEYKSSTSERRKKQDI